MTALPQMTPEQRAAGLEKAREVRAARSAALAKLKDGTIALADFLASDDEVLRKTRVRAVLLALRGVGPARADAVLAAAGVPEGRRVGGLGPVQRAALVDELAPVPV